MKSPPLAIGRPNFRAWAAVIAWVGCIFLIAFWGRPIAQLLRSEGLLVLTLSGSTILFLLILFWRTWKMPEGYKKTYLRTIAAIFFLYFGFLFLMDPPEEWIHLPEYAILGILAHEAFRHHFRGAARIYIGLAFISLIGISDELVQWALPNRFFNWFDIALNLIGGAPLFILLTMMRSEVDSPRHPSETDR